MSKLLVVEKVAAAAVEEEGDLEAEEAEEVEVVLVEAAKIVDITVANQRKRMVLISVIHAVGTIKRN